MSKFIKNASWELICSGISMPKRISNWKFECFYCFRIQTNSCKTKHDKMWTWAWVWVMSVWECLVVETVLVACLLVFAVSRDSCRHATCVNSKRASVFKFKLCIFRIERAFWIPTRGVTTSTTRDQKTRRQRTRRDKPTTRDTDQHQLNFFIFLVIKWIPEIFYSFFNFHLNSVFARFFQWYSRFSKFRFFCFFFFLKIFQHIFWFSIIFGKFSLKLGVGPETAPANIDTFMIVAVWIFETLRDRGVIFCFFFSKKKTDFDREHFLNFDIQPLKFSCLPRLGVFQNLHSVFSPNNENICFSMFSNNKINEHKISVKCVVGVGVSVGGCMCVFSEIQFFSVILNCNFQANVTSNSNVLSIFHFLLSVQIHTCCR